jgi:hypothetical protein
MNGLHLGGGGSKQYRWKMVNHGRPVRVYSSPLLFKFPANGRLAVHQGRAIGDMRGTRGQEERGKRKEERGKRNSSRPSFALVLVPRVAC